MIAENSDLQVVPFFCNNPVPSGSHFDILRDSLPDVVPEPGHDDSVVMLSGYSDQNWIFKNREAAYDLNVAATLRSVRNCIERGVHLVFLSSEAVFGEENPSGWPESAVPIPVTEYGRMKLLVEAAVAGYRNACVVRTGWNIGWERQDRCIIKDTYTQLLSGRARMAEDNVFTLTDVRDLARAVLRVSESRTTGVVHLVSSPPIRRTHLAGLIKDLSINGSSMRFERVRMADLPYLEPRAASAWLRKSDISLKITQDFAVPHEVVSRKVALLDAWR